MRRPTKYASVARTLFGDNGGRLSVKLQDARMGKRDADLDAGIVNEKFRIEIVRRVYDKIESIDNVHKGVGGSFFKIGFNGNIRVNGEYRFFRRFRFVRSDARLVMDDLPLQIRRIDIVVIRNTDGADSGGREVQRCGGAESSGSDDQNASRQELVLAGLSHFF